MLFLAIASLGLKLEPGVRSLHVANCWNLVPGKDSVAASMTADLCQRLMVAHIGEVQLQCLLNEVSDHAVSVELSKEPDWFERASSDPGELDRHFRLPAGQPVAIIRETSYEDGGLGHHVWDASIGMSIWLSRNAARFEGKRVLELGSGVGLCGISAKLSGAASVVLSDYGPASTNKEPLGLEADTLPSAQQLIGNLAYNQRANSLDGAEDAGGGMEVMSLDWCHSLEASFVAAERFPVVIGTDLIYDQVDAKALAATVVSHTAADGVCYLMSTQRDGCAGLTQLHALLEASGSLSLEEFTIINEFGITPSLVLATFRPRASSPVGAHSAEQQSVDDAHKDAGVSEQSTHSTAGVRARANGIQCMSTPLDDPMGEAAVVITRREGPPRALSHFPSAAAFSVRTSSDPRRGLGLFATSAIDEKTHLFDYEGDVIVEASADGIKRSITSAYSVGVVNTAGVNFIVDASDPATSNAARYMNHAQTSDAACNCVLTEQDAMAANEEYAATLRARIAAEKAAADADIDLPALLKELLENPEAIPPPRLHICSSRRIEEGEELMFDYGELFWESMQKRGGDMAL